MTEKIAEVRPNESVGTLVKSRTDKKVSQPLPKNVLIDADAEQLDKITDELINTWRQIGKIHDKYGKLAEEESRHLEDHVSDLLEQRKRLGPKPKCFGTFSKQVLVERGEQCERCEHVAACYKMEKSTTEGLK